MITQINDRLGSISVRPGEGLGVRLLVEVPGGDVQFDAICIDRGLSLRTVGHAHYKVGHLADALGVVDRHASTVLIIIEGQLRAMLNGGGDAGWL